MYMHEIPSEYEEYIEGVIHREFLEDDQLSLTMLNRESINYLIDYYDCSEDDKKFLKTVSISKLRFITIEFFEPEKWYDLSSNNKPTDYYYINQVLDYCLANRDIIEDAYSEFILKAPGFKFGVVGSHVFGGDNRNPRFLGYLVQAGVVIGKWFYFTSGSAPHYHAISKKDLNGTNIKWVQQYDSLEEFRTLNPYIYEDDDYFEFIKQELKLI